MSPRTYILAVGSPFADGLVVHGPFATQDAAEDCALNSFSDSTWFVVPVASLREDAEERGDGAAAEEEAQVAALSVLAATARAHPELLRRGGPTHWDAASLAADLAQAIRDAPALAEYLRREDVE